MNAKFHALRSVGSTCGFLLAVAALSVLGRASTAHGAEQAAVEGRVIDLPVTFPDGSVRFHVAPGRRANEPATDGVGIPVPVGGVSTAAALFDDDFNTRGKDRWKDVLGTSTRHDGKLLADSPQNHVLLRGVEERNVRVSVEGEAAVQMGILARYQGAKGFLLAFYTPKAKRLGFHHAVDGNLGPWIAAIPTDHLTGKVRRMTVELDGDRATATLADEEGHVVSTRCTIGGLTGPGGVGLYHDRTVLGVQRFDDFRLARLTRVVPSDAVQVIVPESALDEQVVWSGGRQVRVKGVAGRFETDAGSLRTVTVEGVADIVPVEKSSADGALFPASLPNRRWLRFEADGFGQPVCGVIYRTDDPVTNGMPLGGLDTGCTDLETTGMLGYSTIFNTHVPRRGPMNVPVLGLSVEGRTWLLCDPQPKQGYGQTQYPVSDPRFDLELDGLETPREIHYWGHYPVADLEFETDGPIRVGLRAWAPFLPGDVVGSMLPGVVWEVRLRNPTEAAHRGTIAFSFPGPLAKEAGAERFTRTELSGVVTGVEVSAPLASYVLGTIGSAEPRLGGGLDTNGAAWAKIADTLPPNDPGQAGTSAAVDFSLPPGETDVVRFVLAWHAPVWNAGGHNWSDAAHRFTHMYAKHYPSARHAARTLGEQHASLLKRILAWQNVLYTEPALPVWLRDSLVNNLHLIAEDGMWAQKKAPLPEWVREEDGLFGMNECPRGCPQIECIPCSFYGNQPLVYFFPESALSTLRGYKGYHYPDGGVVWIFGGCTGGTPPIDFANPTRGYQWATNGISLAAMVDRYLLCSGPRRKEFVAEFYPIIKSSMIFTVEMRKSPSYSIGDRIIAMPRPEDTTESMKPDDYPTEWFEAPHPGWRGMTAHVGGLHLAQLRIAERMAKIVGDDAFAKQCAEWIEAGGQSMEKHLWTGRYYLNFNDPETQSKSDLIFGYQLDGEWVTDQHGLASGLPQDRVLTVLETIKQANIAVTKYGAVNYTNPDGTPAQVAGYGTYSYFPPEALMLAMTYMYNGQKAFGLELARKVWHNIFCLQGYTWDMPNIMRGDVDTGERTFGNDYYQDMMLWSLPAAIEGEDFGAPARRGGLVDRIRRAARGRSD